MAIIIALILWLFFCLWITGGNVTASWILFFAGIIGLIIGLVVYGVSEAKSDQNSDKNSTSNRHGQTNTHQNYQAPIYSKQTPSVQTLPVKSSAPIKQSNMQVRMHKYKELFANCTTIEEIINSYIAFNDEETYFKPSEIGLLKHYMEFNSKFKSQVWTREDLTNRVKEAVSLSQTIVPVVDDSNKITDKTELINSLVYELNRAATDMAGTTLNEEFTKAPTTLNKSRIQEKIELYKTLFADCTTVDEVIEKYIANNSDVKLKNVEIMILRYYLQYHSIFKAQEWSENKIERVIVEKSKDIKIKVQVENNSVFAIYDTHDVQPSHYHNEAISPKSHPYSLFAEMRKIANNFYYDRGAGTFYKQAKFMESFEDSYEEYAEFEMYSPTYMSMNDHQLRTYFSWRTQVRKGVVIETSLSYVFVYIYELLHEIGSDSPMDGYRKLCSLSNNYSKYDKKVERYLKSWIHDYIIYNKLFEEISNAEKEFFFSESDRMEELIKARNAEDSARFSELLNVFSYHNINKSVFFRDYKNDYCNALLLTYKHLEAFYLKNRKNTLVEKMFGAVLPSSWCPYRSAVFFNYKTTNEANIRVNEFEYYSCEKGDWRQYAIASHKIDRTIITEIIKGTESFMRKLYEYPWQLKYEGTTQILSSMIEKAVVSYCEENGKFGEHTRKKATAKKLIKQFTTKSAKISKETKPVQTRSFTEENPETKVEIDRSKLDRIRTEADAVREKLGVEYDFIMQDNTEQIDISSVDTRSSELNSFDAFFGVLSDVQRKALTIILNGNNMSKIIELSQTYRIMPEILLESINELSLDTLNDNIIDTAGEPFVYDEYIDALQEFIKGE